MSTKLIQTNDYLLLIDEEAEIKVGNFYIIPANNTLQKSDNDNEGKYYNGQKVIAYSLLTKEAKELDLPLLPLIGLEKEEALKLI